MLANNGASSGRLFKKKIYRDASTDTNDQKSISITLSHSKSVKVYYSKAFKEFVVSFELGSKKFVFSLSLIKKHLFRKDRTYCAQ